MMKINLFNIKDLNVLNSLYTFHNNETKNKMKIDMPLKDIINNPYNKEIVWSDFLKKKDGEFLFPTYDSIMSNLSQNKDLFLIYDSLINKLLDNQDLVSYKIANMTILFDNQFVYIQGEAPIESISNFSYNLILIYMIYKIKIMSK